MNQLYELLCTQASCTVTGGLEASWVCINHLSHYPLSIDGYIIKLKDFEAMLMGGYSLDATNYIAAGFCSTNTLETIQREEG